MILPDVNVLVYAHDRSSPQYADYKVWLKNVTESDTAFGLSDMVLSGFLRIVTHPKILKIPLSTSDALGFVQDLREHPNCFLVSPKERHWRIFIDLCRHVDARGNSVPDAYLAALAIESGCQWLTADKGFARFPGLNWRHPLDA